MVMKMQKFTKPLTNLCAWWHSSQTFYLNLDLNQGHGSTRWRRQLEDSKAVLEQLTTEQLETLLHDLQLQVLTEDSPINGTTPHQSQYQQQHVTAEVHTHKHVYVVQGD